MKMQVCPECTRRGVSLRHKPHGEDAFTCRYCDWSTFRGGDAPQDVVGRALLDEAQLFADDEAPLAYEVRLLDGGHMVSVRVRFRGHKYLCKVYRKNSNAGDPMVHTSGKRGGWRSVPWSSKPDSVYVAVKAAAVRATTTISVDNHHSAC